jgi:8-oxo-dGTP pyrophosphatase MutT (NUDIX family)
MEFERLVSFLESRLNQGLPGKDAHMDMAPLPIDLRRFESKLPKSHRKSGVLILFYPESNLPFFPLIKRPEYPGIHGGQIALPGGKMELDDPSVIHTALREAEEEIGVDSRKIQVLGQLTDLYIPTSNFLVSPVIGFSEEKPEMIPEEKEVQRIITTDLRQVLNLELRKRKTLEPSPGFQLDAPYFEIEGEVVWGATAMILSELSWLLSKGQF